MAAFAFSEALNPKGNGKLFTLSCSGRYETEILVDTVGANLNRFSRDGADIIGPVYLPNGMQIGGSPVLYPMPNRVRGGVYRFNGKAYDQIKNGKRILLHSLVRDEPFQFESPVVSSDTITLTLWVDFKPGEAVYEGFPFAHKFSMSYILSEEGLEITYTVDNLSDSELPYGFGIHPFFFRHSGDDETLVSLPAESVIVCDEDILPTGKVMSVEGTDFDMHIPRPVMDLKFDTDFFSYPAGKSAEIHYLRSGYKVILKTTDEFNHIIFFISPGNPWFCVENMTCSIDAHNLYADGMQKESGLIVLPPGESKTGGITIAFEGI